jgi:orotidine-5'-phosphate decarboxylase
MDTSSNTLLKRYKQIVSQKNSILCVGLDPALPSQRSKYTMKDDDRLSFMRTIIKDVAPYASTIKLNRQFLIGLTADEIRSLNILIHQNDMLSIIDHKLSDIDSSNESAIFWIKEEGFDAFTFSPFGVNIEQASLLAHQMNLGIIVLTILSNPEAIFYKIAQIEENPIYLYIAERCKKAKVDGFWIGNAEHIDSKDVGRIRQRIGDNVIAMVPLYGKQYLIVKSAIFHYDTKSMITVGAPIIYSDDVVAKAEEYKLLLNGFRSEMENKRSK